MAVLIVSSVAAGVVAPFLVACVRGEPQESLAAVQIMVQLFTLTVLALGVYGATQGGTQREL